MVGVEFYVCWCKWGFYWLFWCFSWLILLGSVFDGYFIIEWGYGGFRGIVKVVRSFFVLMSWCVDSCCFRRSFECCCFRFELEFVELFLRVVFFMSSFN